MSSATSQEMEPLVARLANTSSLRPETSLPVGFSHGPSMCPWQDRRRPRGPYLLRMFALLEMVVIVACCRLLSAQILPLFFTPLATFDVLDLAFRFYICFFCVAIILVELELPIVFFRQSSVLQHFVTRGLLYSFVGLAAHIEADSVQIREIIRHKNSSSEPIYVPWMALLMMMTALPLIVFGILYVLLGVFCMQSVRDRLKQEHEERLKVYRASLLEQDHRQPTNELP